ncbi:hypothetical protein JW964_23730 [candidate division KSB1 bacterium]|nr:hypothetical protein [candidate division KSB1 bacterium]
MKFIFSGKCFFLLFVLIFFQLNSSCEDMILNEETNPAQGYLGMSLPADYSVFEANSPWNLPIPANTEIDPNSEIMIQNLITTLKGLGITPALAINYKKWTSPVHVIDAEKCHKKDVILKSPSGGFYESVDPDQDGIVKNVPLPVGIWPDPAADGHMILVDPIINTAWEFSRAIALPNGNWQASNFDCWDLRGPGYRTPFSGKTWWRAGVRGSGAPYIGGLIRPEEIEAGKLEHALAVGTPINRKKSAPDAAWEVELCSPVASRSDGVNIGPQFIPEGARIQLNPSLNLDSLRLSRDAKLVARTLQKYGAYVVENASGFPLSFQNLGSDGGKWKNFPGLDDLSKIPLKEFRVLKCPLVRKSSENKH